MAQVWGGIQNGLRERAVFLGCRGVAAAAARFPDTVAFACWSCHIWNLERIVPIWYLVMAGAGPVRRVSWRNEI